MARALGLLVLWAALSLAWGVYEWLFQYGVGVQFPTDLRRDAPGFRRRWALTVTLGRTVDLVEPDGSRRLLRPRRGRVPTLRRMLLGWAAVLRPPRSQPPSTRR